MSPLLSPAELPPRTPQRSPRGDDPPFAAGQNRHVSVLVVQHVPAEGPGRIATALDAAGHEVSLVRPYAGEAVPRSVADASGVVVMGGPMGVHDDAQFPNLADELRLLADATATGVPALGICLGAQLLSTALGGEVRPGTTLELGWLPVELTDDGRRDAVLGQAPAAFSPLHWHQDVPGLPPGAVHLARSEATVVQAFAVGVSYGMLFHLEADAAHAAGMAAAFPADLETAGLSAEALAGEPAAVVEPVAMRVLAAWVDLLPAR